MNIKDIAALAEIVRKNELTKLEINGESIVIERAPAAVQAAAPAAAQLAVPEQMHTAEPIAEVQEKEGVYVKSPAVGVFYAAPSPDSKPFVAVGDTVRRGDTLCIIEAMKLMNEINSDVDGKIVEICVGNGQVVEYDQPLFRIV
ncbi:acetyl-CoA carboxylase biotin carboxyl carrier protein [Anaeromassilibacillus senegalensis]|uniref:Biotin carboxyl carrier protein of acetyl-CoA carboxylase n=1 Tax=Anaeromassilibacillus senegalensis TaxID=1673717 RepID=A0ABS9CPK8_9FIRM|nr:acetyl-CoA carboxylase biotin carboxyl carrier protein [Anaeromassilibacillus senegalensis]MCF2652878.1 acetyl-CoA carboxylase biotin carboxyl carrier protein [Anaeromassilibacillus senegalensis]MCI5651551.1 acetyl-CoA carboxylase biotin carboxyl carrier protein [Ruminococcus bromii]MDD7645706.1 acetyl-CoA carboxylase biotin carboxyl carrier protein [Ruminococcus bromii]